MLVVILYVFLLGSVIVILKLVAPLFDGG